MPEIRWRIIRHLRRGCCKIADNAQARFRDDSECTGGFREINAQ